MFIAELPKSFFYISKINVMVTGGFRGSAHGMCSLCLNPKPNTLQKTNSGTNQGLRKNPNPCHQMPFLGLHAIIAFVAGSFK